MSNTNIRKQVYELSLDDLHMFPVWEFALDEESEEGQDEATVRPYEFKEVLDPSESMVIVHAEFKLADGTKMEGYLMPSVNGERRLDILQPVIITKNGQIVFWHGVLAPSSEYVARCYEQLGKSAADVFPIAFTSAVSLVGEKVKGSLPGFLVLENLQSGKTKIIT